MDMSNYEDDKTIQDEAELWRRINPDWIVPDEKPPGLRVSSAAFNDSRDGTPLSVLLAEIVRHTGRTAQDIIAPFPGFSLASITAGVARAQRQGIARTPTTKEPAHASVIGPKTKAIRQALAKAATWVVAPSQAA